MSAYSKLLYIFGRYRENSVKEVPSRVTPVQRRRKICWDSFQREAQDRTSTRPVETPDDVERATEELTIAIQDSLTAASHTSAQANRLSPLPARIRDLIRKKRETRKLWQETRCPRVKTELNALIERVRVALDDHAAEGWEDHISSITDDIPSVHRLCRQLANTPKPVQPLIGSDGLLKFEAADRAEILAEFLEKQLSPNPTNDQSHVETVERLLGEYLSTPQSPEEDLIRDNTDSPPTLPPLPARVGTPTPAPAASVADRLAGPSLGNQGSHPARSASHRH
ncbi:putative endonuclease and reverse transcriptase-like protein [Operophtera brumata]|uniref:Putative endonuclease and reverse transcriptase-like protein n=1 Tax=Operophtera brumata TaxID=104452 RepID=A0A0L7KXL7_OPEBR|nr:putative endonuclease and reverse transcriptase-like protein [Operophtera brumata]